MIIFTCKVPKYKKYGKMEIVNRVKKTVMKHPSSEIMVFKIIDILASQSKLWMKNI